MKYTVEITETLQKQIVVNADSKDDAIAMAEELYHNGDEVLYAEDLKETQFQVIQREDIMVKVYGYSDDLVEIEGSNYSEDEIDCFDKDVEIEFEDGTKILVGYNKPNMGVWYIKVLNKGTAEQTLEICEDEDARPYSDVFTINSEIKCHRVISQKRRLEE